MLRKKGGLTKVYADFAAANTMPGLVYEEGAAYGDTPPLGEATLTRASRSWKKSRRLDHLAGDSVRIRPGADLGGGKWRLKVRVDGSLPRHLPRGDGPGAPDRRHREDGAGAGSTVGATAPRPVPFSAAAVGRRDGVGRQRLDPFPLRTQDDPVAAPGSPGTTTEVHRPRQGRQEGEARPLSVALRRPGRRARPGPARSAPPAPSRVCGRASGGVGAPRERPVLDVGPPRVHDLAQPGVEAERRDHPVGGDRADALVHLGQPRVGDPAAVHERQVELPPPVDLLDHRGHHRAHLDRTLVALVGRGVAQDPAARPRRCTRGRSRSWSGSSGTAGRGRCPPRPRSGPARGPGSGCRRSAEADADELPAPVVGAEAAAYGVGHAIEHCSTMCVGSTHGLLPLPPRQPTSRRACATSSTPRSSRSRPTCTPRITAPRESGGDNWTPDPRIKELQAKAREQGLWNLFLPAGARRPVRRGLRHRRRRGPEQRRLRPAGRGDGRLVPRAARLQLQRPRHRQHGGAAALRHRRAAGDRGSSRCCAARSAAPSA